MANTFKVKLPNKDGVTASLRNNMSRNILLSDLLHRLYYHIIDKYRPELVIQYLRPLETKIFWKLEDKL